MKRYVVIDKSYLQGATKSEIHRLCTDGAFMTDTLFAELITAMGDWKKCFAKFPAIPNPVEVIPSVGALLRYESSNRAPCTPLYERRGLARFTFHPGLATGTYKLSEKDLEAVRAIEGETKERVASFRETSSDIQSWFPEVNGFPANGPQAIIDRAKSSVARDKDRVRAIYGQIISGMKAMIASGEESRVRDFSPPDPHELDERWAWYCFLQARLLAALEFVRKNGIGSLGQTSDRDVEHDLLDAEYVAVAALSGTLASRDKMPQSFFRLLCPEGVLVS